MCYEWSSVDLVLPGICVESVRCDRRIILTFLCLLDGGVVFMVNLSIVSNSIINSILFYSRPQEGLREVDVEALEKTTEWQNRSWEWINTLGGEFLLAHIQRAVQRRNFTVNITLFAIYKNLRWAFPENSISLKGDPLRKPEEVTYCGNLNLLEIYIELTLSLRGDPTMSDYFACKNYFLSYSAHNNSAMTSTLRMYEGVLETVAAGPRRPLGDELVPLRESLVIPRPPWS